MDQSFKHPINAYSSLKQINKQNKEPNFSIKYFLDLLENATKEKDEILKLEANQMPVQQFLQYLVMLDQLFIKRAKAIRDTQNTKERLELLKKFNDDFTTAEEYFLKNKFLPKNFIATVVTLSEEELSFLENKGIIDSKTIPSFNMQDDVTSAYISCIELLNNYAPSLETLNQSKQFEHMLSLENPPLLTELFVYIILGSHRTTNQITSKKSLRFSWGYYAEDDHETSHLSQEEAAYVFNFGLLKAIYYLEYSCPEEILIIIDPATAKKHQDALSQFTKNLIDTHPQRMIFPHFSSEDDLKLLNDIAESMPSEHINKTMITSGALDKKNIYTLSFSGIQPTNTELESIWILQEAFNWLSEHLTNVMVPQDLYTIFVPYASQSCAILEQNLANQSKSFETFLKNTQKPIITIKTKNKSSEFLNKIADYLRENAKLSLLFSPKFKTIPFPLPLQKTFTTDCKLSKLLNQDYTTESFEEWKENVAHLNEAPYSSTRATIAQIEQDPKLTKEEKDTNVQKTYEDEYERYQKSQYDHRVQRINSALARDSWLRTREESKKIQNQQLESQIISNLLKPLYQSIEQNTADPEALDANIKTFFALQVDSHFTTQEWDKNDVLTCSQEDLENKSLQMTHSIEGTVQMSIFPFFIHIENTNQTTADSSETVDNIYIRHDRICTEDHGFSKDMQRFEVLDLDACLDILNAQKQYIANQNQSFNCASQHMLLSSSIDHTSVSQQLSFSPGVFNQYQFTAISTTTLSHIEQNAHFGKILGQDLGGALRGMPEFLKGIIAYPTSFLPSIAQQVTSKLLERHSSTKRDVQDDLRQIDISYFHSIPGLEENEQSNYISINQHNFHEFFSFLPVMGVHTVVVHPQVEKQIRRYVTAHGLSLAIKTAKTLKESSNQLELQRRDSELLRVVNHASSPRRNQIYPQWVEQANNQIALKEHHTLELAQVWENGICVNTNTETTQQVQRQTQQELEKNQKKEMVSSSPRVNSLMGLDNYMPPILYFKNQNDMCSRYQYKEWYQKAPNLGFNKNGIPNTVSSSLGNAPYLQKEGPGWTESTIRAVFLLDHFTYTPNHPYISFYENNFQLSDFSLANFARSLSRLISQQCSPYVEFFSGKTKISGSFYSSPLSAQEPKSYHLEVFFTKHLFEEDVKEIELHDNFVSYAAFNYRSHATHLTCVYDALENLDPETTFGTKLLRTIKKCISENYQNTTIQKFLSDQIKNWKLLADQRVKLLLVSVVLANSAEEMNLERQLDQFLRCLSTLANHTLINKFIRSLGATSSDDNQNVAQLFIENPWGNDTIIENICQKLFEHIKKNHIIESTQRWSAALLQPWLLSSLLIQMIRYAHCQDLSQLGQFKPISPYPTTYELSSAVSQRYPLYLYRISPIEYAERLKIQSDYTYLNGLLEEINITRFASQYHQAISSNIKKQIHQFSKLEIITIWQYLCEAGYFQNDAENSNDQKKAEQIQSAYREFKQDFLKKNYGDINADLLYIVLTCIDETVNLDRNNPDHLDVCCWFAPILTLEKTQFVLFAQVIRALYQNQTHKELFLSIKKYMPMRDSQIAPFAWFIQQLALQVQNSGTYLIYQHAIKLIDKHNTDCANSNMNLQKLISTCYEIHDRKIQIDNSILASIISQYVLQTMNNEWSKSFIENASSIIDAAKKYPLTLHNAELFENLATYIEQTEQLNEQEENKIQEHFRKHQQVIKSSRQEQDILNGMYLYQQPHDSAQKIQNKHMDEIQSKITSIYTNLMDRMQKSSESLDLSLFKYEPKFKEFHQKKLLNPKEIGQFLDVCRNHFQNIASLNDNTLPIHDECVIKLLPVIIHASILATASIDKKIPRPNQILTLIAACCGQKTFANVAVGEGKTLISAITLLTRWALGEYTYFITTADNLTYQAECDWAPLFNALSIPAVFVYNQTMQIEPASKEIIVVCSAESGILWSMIHNLPTPNSLIFDECDKIIFDMVSNSYRVPSPHPMINQTNISRLNYEKIMSYIIELFLEPHKILNLTKSANYDFNIMNAKKDFKTFIKKEHNECPEFAALLEEFKFVFSNTETQSYLAISLFYLRQALFHPNTVKAYSNYKEKTNQTRYPGVGSIYAIMKNQNSTLVHVPISNGTLQIGSSLAHCGELLNLYFRNFNESGEKRLNPNQEYQFKYPTIVTKQHSVLSFLSSCKLNFLLGCSGTIGTNTEQNDLQVFLKGQALFAHIPSWNQANRAIEQFEGKLPNINTHLNDYITAIARFIFNTRCKKDNPILIAVPDNSSIIEILSPSIQNTLSKMIQEALNSGHTIPTDLYELLDKPIPYFNCQGFATGEKNSPYTSGSKGFDRFLKEAPKKNSIIIVAVAVAGRGVHIHENYKGLIIGDFSGSVGRTLDQLIGRAGRGEHQGLIYTYPANTKPDPEKSTTLPAQAYVPILLSQIRNAIQTILQDRKGSDSLPNDRACHIEAQYQRFALLVELETKPLSDLREILSIMNRYLVEEFTAASLPIKQAILLKINHFNQHDHNLTRSKIQLPLTETEHEWQEQIIINKHLPDVLSFLDSLKHRNPVCYYKLKIAQTHPSPADTEANLAYQFSSSLALCTAALSYSTKDAPDFSNFYKTHYNTYEEIFGADTPFVYNAETKSMQIQWELFDRDNQHFKKRIEFFNDSYNVLSIVKNRKNFPRFLNQHSTQKDMIHFSLNMGALSRPALSETALPNDNLDLKIYQNISHQSIAPKIAAEIGVSLETASQGIQQSYLSNLLYAPFSAFMAALPATLSWNLDWNSCIEYTHASIPRTIIQSDMADPRMHARVQFITVAAISCVLFAGLSALIPNYMPMQLIITTLSALMDNYIAFGFLGGLGIKIFIAVSGFLCLYMLAKKALALDPNGLIASIIYGTYNAISMHIMAGWANRYHLIDILGTFLSNLIKSLYAYSTEIETNQIPLSAAYAGLKYPALTNLIERLTYIICTICFELILKPIRFLIGSMHISERASIFLEKKIKGVGRYSYMNEEKTDQNPNPKRIPILFTDSELYACNINPTENLTQSTKNNTAMNSSLPGMF